MWAFLQARSLCKFYANQSGKCLHVGYSPTEYLRTEPKTLTIQLRPGGCGCYYGNSRWGCVRAWCLLGCSSQSSRALHRARRPQGFCGTPPLSLQNRDSYNYPHTVSFCWFNGGPQSRTVDFGIFVLDPPTQCFIRFAWNGVVQSGQMQYMNKVYE